MKNLTSKQLGDAGEHMIAAELSFAGFPTVMMPDNWPDYDLIFMKDNVNLTVQVKTCRTLPPGSWVCEFSEEMRFDYLSIVEASTRRNWLIPRSALVEHARRPETAKNPCWWVNTNQLLEDGNLVQYKGCLP